MIFLIEYDRPTGRIIKFRKFNDTQRREAENFRFKIEVELNRENIKREVVLLEAESLQALRRTHRRYFENLSKLVPSKKSMHIKDGRKN